MKLGIFGSRTLTDARVKAALLEACEKFKPDMIVTAQEPRGVCEVGQQVAKELGLPLELHFLNFRFLRGAFHHRSTAIIKAADHLIILHDGASKGTANEIVLTKKLGKPFDVEVMEPDPLSKNIGFNISNDWNAPPADLSGLTA